VGSKKRVGRPRADERTRPLAVRLPESVIRAIDSYAETLKAERPGVPVSRNAAITVLLLAGLKAKRVTVQKPEVANAPKARTQRGGRRGAA